MTNFESLIDRYIDEIEVECASFQPVTDSTGPDAAMLTLSVPVAMLREFLKMSGKADERHRDLPDGVDFWRRTRLWTKLKGKTIRANYADHLEDMLEYLELAERVQVDYSGMSQDKKRIKLGIIEITRDEAEDI